MNPETRRVQREMERLAWGVALAAVFVIAVHTPRVLPDTWWHLRTGQWVWQHRAWPTHDPFSFTRYAAAWSPPGPPVQVLMYGLFRLGGLWALEVGTGLLAVAGMAFLMAALRAQDAGSPLLRAATVVWAALTATVYWAARPHMVTFVLAAWFLWALETHRLGRAGFRRLWALPPLLAFWANAHGGFIMGPALVAAYTVPALARRARAGGWRRLPADPTARAWAVLGLALLIAPVLNPTGLARWLYPFQTVGMRLLRAHIAEWQPPQVSAPALWPFLAWWFGLVLALGLSRRGLPAEHLLLWLGLGALAWSAVRHVALFALAAALVWYLPAATALRRFPLGNRRPARAARARPALNTALLAMLALAALLTSWQPYATGQRQAYVRATYPVAAVRFLQRTRPQARLFNHYDWGAYLLWAWPEQKVFIDGRTDLYGDPLLQEYLTVVRADPGWQEVLARWGIDTILAAPDWPLLRVLPRAGWVEVYADGHAVVWARAPRPGR